MKDFFALLRKKQVLLLDGAMGTMLMNKGSEWKGCPEELNIQNSKILEQIASEYLKAGADIIQTNTFGASPIKLSRYSLEKKYKIINSNAVKAVKKIVKDKGLIAASCGPSGDFLKPYGNVEPEELYISFKKQFEILIQEGVDIINIETMTDIREAKLAVKAAKDINSRIPVFSSMTFNKNPNGFFTIMGTNIKDSIKELEEAGADIVGSNCGNGTNNMILIAREIKKNTEHPIIIQPNAGVPKLIKTKTIYPETPKFMGKKAKELIEIGISLIGGCCGTTPEHIKQIRDTIDSFLR